ncbi:MAG: hypothetical protein H7068_10755 [Pedobacter sp.]|nr:hypothetical protein [Chitinophagaceae bacterium]
MKLLLVIVTSYIGFSVNTQQLITALIKPTNPLHIYSNAYKNIDNMPIASVGATNQILMFSKNQGFNIYKSQPDNMPTIKPDTSFYDKMNGGNFRNNIDPEFLKALIDLSNTKPKATYKLLQPQTKDSALPKDLFKNYKPKY